jgi:hypothetical protein
LKVLMNKLASKMKLLIIFNITYFIVERRLVGGLNTKNHRTPTT